MDRVANATPNWHPLLYIFEGRSELAPMPPWLKWGARMIAATVVIIFIVHNEDWSITVLLWAGIRVGLDVIIGLYSVSFISYWNRSRSAWDDVEISPYLEWALLYFAISEFKTRHLPIFGTARSARTHFTSRAKRPCQILLPRGPCVTARFTNHPILTLRHIELSRGHMVMERIQSKLS